MRASTASIFRPAPIHAPAILFAAWSNPVRAISPGAIQGLDLLFAEFVVMPLAVLAGAGLSAVLNHKRGAGRPYAASFAGAVLVFLLGEAWLTMRYGRDAEHAVTILMASLGTLVVPVLVIGLVVGAVAAAVSKRTARRSE